MEQSTLEEVMASALAEGLSEYRVPGISGGRSSSGLDVQVHAGTWAYLDRCARDRAISVQALVAQILNHVAARDRLRGIGQVQADAGARGAVTTWG